MSLSEQKFFKSQFVNSQNTEPKLIHLYDIIAEMENYDEEKVKEKLNNPSFSKNLKVHKNRLYQLLLNSLVKHSSSNTIVQQIRTNIDIVDVLIKKKMFKQLRELIDKTKKMCIEYEEYELLIVVQGMELRQLMYFKEKENNADTVIQDMRNNLIIMDNYLRYAQVNHQLIQMKFYQDDRLQNIKKLDDELKVKYLLKDNQLVQPLSDIANRMDYHCQSIVYALDGKHKDALDCTRNILIVMQKKPNLIKEKPTVYFNAIFNHMCNCAIVQYWDELELYKEKIYELVDKHAFLSAYLIYPYTLLIEIYRERGLYQEAYNLYRNKVYSPNHNYEKYANYPIDYFLIQMLEVLLNLNKKEEIFDLLNCLQKDLAKVTEHLAPMVWIFQIIVYIQYEEFKLLSSYLEALRKRLQRHKIQHNILNKLIALAQKICVKPKEQHINLYKKHLEYINQLVDNKNLEITNLKILFNYQKWLKRQSL